MSRQKQLVKGRDGFFRLSLSEFFWLVVLNLALFRSAIQEATGFTYVDELATLMLLAAAIAKAVAPRGLSHTGLPHAVRASMNVGVASMVVVIALGLLGNAKYGFQIGTMPIATDVFTCCKFPIALVSSIVVFREDETFARVAIAEAKVLAIVILAFGLLNVVYDFGMGFDFRFGIRSFRFVFPHPTYLVFFLVGLSILLMRDVKGNFGWLLIVFTSTLLSCRTKGIVFVAISLLLMFLLRDNRKLSWMHIVAIVAIALVVGWDQYVTYFDTPGYARSEMARASLEIANDLFPLGGGFATFGSAVTADLAYYSPLYYVYGLSQVWGLEPGNPLFISDTFWPTVLGQFGYLGCIAYAASLVALLIATYMLSGTRRLAVLSCFAYLFISSTSESAFFNPQSVSLAICLGLALATTRNALGQSVE